mmetsp:Transcript_24803/g.53939  ORF Transcript_24803/g.53939 Transcript_24803/m.53939 type:complete len:234 (-) Transcript_24803:1323-2024(-)
MTEFSDQVGAESDQGLVQRLISAGRQILEGLASCVALKFVLVRFAHSLFEASNDLHHTVPNFVRDRVWGAFEHPENNVHVPTEVGCIPFSEDGNFQDELLLQQNVARAEDLEQLVDDVLPVRRRAERVEEVEGLPADGDIAFVHLFQDEIFVALQMLVHALHYRQSSHRFQAQVPDVRIRRGDKRTQQPSRGAEGVGVASFPQLNHQIHRFEENGMLRVGPVLSFGIGLRSLF